MSNLRSVYTGAFYAVRCCASGKLGVSNFLRVSFIRNINCLVWCYQLLSSMFLAFKWFVFASNFVVKWCVYASVIVVKWCVHTSNFGGSFDLKGRRLFTVKWRLLLLDGINLLQRFFSIQNKLKCCNSCIFTLKDGWNKRKLLQKARTKPTFYLFISSCTYFFVG